MENLNRTFQLSDSDCHLTILQIRILTQLCRQEQTVGKMGQSLGIARANVSVMCKKLENQGLLQRSRDSQDERIVRLSLTQKGKETIQAIQHTLDRRYAPALQQQSQEDLQTMLDGLYKLNAMLQKITAEPQILTSEKSECEREN